MIKLLGEAVGEPEAVGLADGVTEAEAVGELLTEGVGVAVGLLLRVSQRLTPKMIKNIAMMSVTRVERRISDCLLTCY
jgi:hypothetical protein